MERLTFPFPFQEDRNLGWKKSFRGPLGNNGGQTLVTWLVLMSLILLVTISVGSAMTLIQNRMQAISVCRMESLRAQSEVEPMIKKLFSLNPEAKLLRLLMIAAKARLVAAVAHFNAPMAAQARYDIARIRERQKALDRTQKILVQTANITLHRGTFSTYSKLKATFQEIKARGVGWADIEFNLRNPRIPKLAVKPEDHNLAPSYITRKNFEKQQATSQFWTQTYRIKGLFKFTHQSQSQCHATLEENTWVPKIRKDKLYSRWL